MRGLLREYVVGFAALALHLLSACEFDERSVETVDTSLLTADGVVNGDSGVRDNTGSPASNAVPGTGSSEGSGAGTSLVAPARLEVDRRVLDFGPVALNTPSLGVVRVFHSGGSLLAPPSIELLGSEGAFSILQNRCLEPLGPSAECQVRIQFQPLAASVSTSGLQVSSEAGEVLTVELSGSGVEAGGLGLSPDATGSPNFGGVVIGGRLEGTFALSNVREVASGPLTFILLNSEFELVAPANEECVAGTTSLAPGASCNLRVAFEPSYRRGGTTWPRPR